MSEKKFTDALADLQKSAAEIGKPTTSLEESLKLFENGMKEAAFCRKVLDEAEQKIEVYVEKEETCNE